MAEVVIYVTPTCPFCKLAKDLLKKRDVKYVEIDVLASLNQRQAMAERAGGSSKVPQIFIDGEHVGGCDELYELDFDGGLASLSETEK